MWTRLIENWPYKIAALAIAILLKIYVAGVNDPHTARQMTVPISLNRVPDNLVVSDATPMVTLQISGSQSSLDALSSTSFTATVDLGRAHAGVNQPLAIDVIPTAGTSPDINVETLSPRTASVTMDVKRHARFPVHIDFRRVAPSGLAYGTPSVMPEFATVEGPDSAVSKIATLAVYADEALTGEASHPGIIDGIGTIVPLDGQQTPIPGLTVIPQQAEIRVPVMRQAAVKDLIVDALVTGTPKYPAQVESVEVLPSRLSVTGAPDMLAQTSVVTTAPIDITNATGDVRRTTTVTLPTGLTLVQKQDVEVIVHIGVPVSKPKEPANNAPTTTLTTYHASSAASNKS